MKVIATTQTDLLSSLLTEHVIFSDTVETEQLIDSQMWGIATAIGDFLKLYQLPSNEQDIPDLCDYINTTLLSHISAEQYDQFRAWFYTKQGNLAKDFNAAKAVFHLGVPNNYIYDIAANCVLSGYDYWHSSKIKPHTYLSHGYNFFNKTHFKITNIFSDVNRVGKRYKIGKKSILASVETSSLRVLTQEAMSNIWETYRTTNPSPVKKYHKFGRIEARLAKPGEIVVTIIKGEKETENTAGDSDVVMKGPLGEEYVISLIKFKDRYEGPKLSKNYQYYKAVGSVYACKWDKKLLKFIAPWGEEVIIKPGDMLCSSTLEANGDIYRIEKSAFKKTYA